MRSEELAQSVMSHYPACLAPQSLVGRGAAGGFSGARFWQVVTPSGMVCLRRWPSGHPTRERLAEIHTVLRHVQRNGLSCIAAPLADDHGNTIVTFSRHLWEVTPWMPGSANYRRHPTPKKLQAALETLARFHTTAATLPGLHHPSTHPRGILERRQLLDELVRGGAQQIRLAMQRQSRSQLADRARRILPLFHQLIPHGTAMLDQAVVAVATQPCIRDIWHDHVLYTGDDVTGIVDFGALRVDSVAGDIARLLGSLVGDCANDRETGLASYERIRPLSSDEHQLVETYDVTGVMLSGMNWLRWIYLEKRQFDDMPTILNRLDEIIVRLENLAGGRGLS